MKPVHETPRGQTLVMLNFILFHVGLHPINFSEQGSTEAIAFGRYMWKTKQVWRLLCNLDSSTLQDQVLQPGL